MKRRMLLSLLSFVFAVPLAGCWDIKSLQDVNYFTGIGIDFKDNKYQIYVQQLDFSSVARTGDGGKGDKPANVWIGHAEGKSIAQAVVDLYQTSQQTVFWGHLKTIILSENALKHGNLLGVFDALLRSPEIRYTPWVYGTKKEIPELFMVKPFFNLSPLNSILYSPETNYNQRPVIKPLRLSQFIRSYREPGETVLLPSLSISDHTWDQNAKPDPKLEVDGIFAMRNDSFKGWMDYTQLSGKRWLVKKTNSARIFLKQGDEVVVTLKLSKPKSKIRITVHKDEPIFDVRIEVTAGIAELWKPLSEIEAERMANAYIAKQIKETYRSGQKQKIDPLNLEHALYRTNFDLWKKLTSDGKTPLDPIILNEVKVKVEIARSGTYKLKRKFTPY